MSKRNPVGGGSSGASQPAAPSSKRRKLSAGEEAELAARGEKDSELAAMSRNDCAMRDVRDLGRRPKESVKSPPKERRLATRLWNAKRRGKQSEEQKEELAAMSRNDSERASSSRASQRAEAGRPPQSVMEEIRNFFRKRKAIALQKVHHTLSSCSSSHRPWSVALLWILSSSVPCGFFPLGDSVLSVLFHDVVESFRFRAVWILSTRRLIVVVAAVFVVVIDIVVVGFGVIVIVVVIAVTILVGYIPIVGFSCHVSAHACEQRGGLVVLLSLRILRTIKRN